MGKFVGWKCDMCNNAEDGNDAPVDWFRLKLPSTGSDNARDLCSDKCLLKFARERAGLVAPKRSRNNSDPKLMDWMRSQGLGAHAVGGTIGNHVRRRHELVGVVDDCLVCQWITTESSTSTLETPEPLPLADSGRGSTVR